VLPSLTLLVAAHDEAGYVRRLLDAIALFEYPRDRLAVVLVDDGSEDETYDILARWAEQQPHATALRLPERRGKPGALNYALSVIPPTDLVGVCDADHEPHPDSLRRVVAALEDDTVGAAGAFLQPVNANAGLVARYAAVEAWVTQLVTSVARSRLDLNPPMLGGGSVYRRQALEEIGGFPGGLTGEDAAATIAITRNGWRTRFVREAVVDNRVVEQHRQYWSQHVRWARSGYETVRLHHGGRAPLGRRIEAWMVSAGYSDRIALLAAVGFAAVGVLPIWVPAAYLGVIGLAVVAAIARGGEIRRLPSYLVAMVVMLLVDAAATLYAGVLQLRRRPLQWRTMRAPPG
jgi:cellulose synthase/poly-beta-1,6-N-acetylglucosamine synthase-like glycosyltransferase